MKTLRMRLSVLALVTAGTIIACSTFGAGLPVSPIPSVEVPSTAIGAPAEQPSVPAPEATGAAPEEPGPDAPGGVEPEGWLTYQDDLYGFAVGYPEGSSQVTPDGESPARINLPFAPNFNLLEKYLQIDARSGVASCTSPLTEGAAPGTIVPEAVTFGGLEWVKESGANAGAGNLYEFAAYSTTQGDVCVTLSFVLHSTNPDNYTPPLEEFDRETESAVFEAIVQSFHWLS